MRSKLLFLIFVLALAAACSTAPKEKKIRIGFAMDTVREERWQRDKDAFEAHCKQLNVECEITVADNKDDKQANDVDNLLTKGVDVLVIAPPRQAVTVSTRPLPLPPELWPGASSGVR